MLRKLVLCLLPALAVQSVANAQYVVDDSLVPVPQVQAIEPDGGEIPGDGEVLLTGPLHEAYAEQFTVEPTPGLIVNRQPPDPIEEIPPEYRPDGYNVVWVPGYWGWDVERDDFVWVTGIWREVPPDRSWIPGYWAQVPEGYQWISGFWSLNTDKELIYLPQPPQVVETGPSVPPPGDDYFWIPGQWTWMNDDYRWRAGYWSIAHSDWIWVPERYVYTPRGYIYRVGYWDYLLPNRGTIFCPVYWTHPVATYRFRPSYVVDVGTNLLANLFVHPRYHHYYFGNYYSSPHLGRTIYPWVTFNQQSHLYDSLYGYYHTQRRDADYLRHVTQRHTHYANNPHLQPPRNLAMQLRTPHVHGADGRAFRATHLHHLADDRHHWDNDRQRNNDRHWDDDRHHSTNDRHHSTNDRHHSWQVKRLRAEEREQLQRGLEPARQLRVQRARIETQFDGSVPDAGRPAESIAGRRTEGRPGEGRSREAQPNDETGGSRRGYRWQLPTSPDGISLGATTAVAPSRRSDPSSDQRGGRNDLSDDARKAAAWDRARDEAAARAAQRPQTQSTQGPRPQTQRPGIDLQTRPGMELRTQRPGMDLQARPGMDLQTQRPGIDLQTRPGMDLRTQRPGMDLQTRPGMDLQTQRPGMDLRGPDRRSVQPGVTQPQVAPLGVAQPGARPDQPRAVEPGTARPQVDGLGRNRQGTPWQGPSGWSRPGGDGTSGQRPDVERRSSRRPELPPAGVPGSNLPNIERPNIDRSGGQRAGEPRSGWFGASPTERALPGGARAPGIRIPDQRGSQGGMQLSPRREFEPQRSAPPELRSLPQRSQPAPNVSRPQGAARSGGWNINPAPRPSAPAGGSASRGGGGWGGGDARPGRGGGDRGRGSDKEKDKGKGKDK